MYGVIWEIDVDDLLQLDETEDPKAYTRETVIVNTLDGQKHDCHIYKAIPQGVFEPDKQYLNETIEAALEAGLPATVLHRTDGRSPVLSQQHEIA